MDQRRRMVIDLAARRPGCAMVQAGFGVSCNDLLAHFEPHTWIVAPTDTMKIILGTEAEFLQLAKEANLQPTNYQGAP